MSLSDYQYTQVTDFQGAWTDLEPSDVPSDRALEAVNCEFNYGKVSSRTGFGEWWNNGEPVSSIVNWVKNPDAVMLTGNGLIYFNPTSQKARLVWGMGTPGSNNGDLYTASGGYALSVAQTGLRAYSAAFNTSQAGVAQARVTFVSGSSLYTDKCFLGPLSNKPTLAEGGAGNCTAGVHRVGYIIQTRSGFTGRISPVSASTGQFDTTSSITSSGSKTITFSLNITWPTEAASVYPVMAPVYDPNSFYIPNNMSAYAVPGGSPFLLSFTFDISDEDLVANGTNVTDNFNLLTMDSGGNGPFNPYHVFECGDRMGYMAIVSGVPTIYISEPSNPQAISQDQNAITLPGNRLGLTTFVDRGVLYVIGPHWTYSFEIGPNKPVEWPTAQLVDGNIGTMSIRGVARNVSKGFAWVAAREGLYYFNGQYSALPVSYRNSDYWRRINWNYAHTIEVVDNPSAQCVYVKVPLDSETAPSTILVWDYQRGIGHNDVSFTTYTITGFSFGGIAVVMNESTKQLELWTGRATTGKILRKKLASETSAYNDDGAAIVSSYRTANLPGLEAPTGTLYAHHGVQIRALGSGNLTVYYKSLDAARQKQLPNVRLESAPGKEVLLRSHFINEAASITFSNSTANENWVLSSLKHYYTAFASRR